MHLKPLTLIGIIISLVTGTAGGVFLHQHNQNRTVSQPVTTLGQALRHVNRNYVEHVSEEELLDFAINGMMNGLDEHSAYLNHADYDALQTNTTGRFGGIGIELGLVDGYFTVIAPMDGTPADLAGVKSGDRITALDGEPVKGKKMTDMIRLLRGEPESMVSVRVARQDESITFELQRQLIALTSVRGRMLEPGYGYIRIAQFQTSTPHDLENLLRNLTTDSYVDAPALQGLVLDLRNNPGGTLLSSVEVADLFLDSGLIVYTEGRLKSSFAKYRATKGDELNGAPIIVLINSGSASASEVVAGALQDHGRAKLVGSKSYGKGSVQSVVPLNDNQALKITTAHYFTPNGRSIHNKGIMPDVPLVIEEQALLAEVVQMLKAAQPSTGTLRAELITPN